MSKKKDDTRDFTQQKYIVFAFFFWILFVGSTCYYYLIHSLPDFDPVNKWKASDQQRGLLNSLSRTPHQVPI